jgi:hypothetical protein
VIDIDLDIAQLGLTDRGKEYYRAHHHPYFVDGTPCWAEQRFGYIKDASCGAIQAGSGSDFLGILKRDAFTYDAAGKPIFVNGAPCYDNGRFGFFRDALCIFADLDVDLVKNDVVGIAKKGLPHEPVWTDGTPCWKGGRFGYIKDKSCFLVDTEIKVGLKKRAVHPELVDGEPCWDEDRFGHLSHGACNVRDQVGPCATSDPRSISMSSFTSVS